MSLLAESLSTPHLAASSLLQASGTVLGCGLSYRRSCKLVTLTFRTFSSRPCFCLVRHWLLCAVGWPCLSNIVFWKLNPQIWMLTVCGGWTSRKQLGFLMNRLSYSLILGPMNYSGNVCVLKANSSWYPCSVLPRDAPHHAVMQEDLQQVPTLHFWTFQFWGPWAK